MSSQDIPEENLPAAQSAGHDEHGHGAVSVADDEHPFADPGLPPQLLPGDWPGHEAARRFASEAERLLPGADRFIDRCLA